MEPFFTGQRWMSEMEPELGLGTIIDVEHRLVRIRFEASETERTYAKNTAPLKRIVFRVGDNISLRDGASHKVTSVEEMEGVVFYNTDAGEFPEIDIADNQTITAPIERLWAGFFDTNKQFNLRFRALQFLSQIKSSPLRGFVGGRIDLIPHQLYVTNQVAQRRIPRVLLADEVGLGKTIEACLIMHRLLQSGRINRVLIVVPEPLVHQWFVELLRKFNMLFRIVDDEFLATVQRIEPDTNPFLKSQLCLVSSEYVSHDPDLYQLAVAAEWDMLIVDEAHHLTEETNDYKFIKELSQLVPGLLLLTATPEQLGHYHHFLRLNLLDSARYYDFEKFEQESEQYHHVAQMANKLLDQKKLDENEQDLLKKLVPEATSNDQILQKLLDRHGLGRVLYRNTRSNMSNFPKRLVHIVPFECEENCKFVNDPRIEWLINLAEQLKDEKILLICHTKEKTRQVDEAIKKLSSVQTALFDEDMTIIQRDKNAAWFAHKFGAQILLCSEIGSEGRNFQFAHHLVLFDVPDDPELLEQRIGRLDRIGQKNDIHIHVPYLKNTAQEIFVKWYHDGMNAFEKNVIGAYKVFQGTKELLEKAIDENNSEELVSGTKKLVDEISKEYEAGRDRLLEIHSFDKQSADSVVNAIKQIDRNEKFDEFWLQFLEYFGIYGEEIANRTLNMDFTTLENPSFPIPPMRGDQFVVTFDRQRAVHHEDIEFLTIDHPMVTNTIELFLGEQVGNCAVAEWPEAPQQGLLLETVFVLEAIANTRLHINRFLPPTPVRIVVDSNFADKSDEFTLRQMASKIRGLAQLEYLKNPEVIEYMQKMLDECHEVGKKRVQDILTNSSAKMHKTLTEELDRLIALQKVNPAVTDDEISAIKNERDLLEKEIANARLRLDAVRVVFMM